MLVRGTASTEDLKSATDRLAIVGTRRFVAPFGLTRAEHVVRQHLADRPPDLLLSGGADGVDALAERVADEMGIPALIFLPEEPTWRAYRLRNAYIAGNCTRLLRVACAYSTTYGSGWTRDRAEERLGSRRVRSYVVDYDGARPEGPRR